MGRYSQTALVIDVPDSQDSLDHALEQIVRTSAAVIKSKEATLNSWLACRAARVCIREFRELKDRTYTVIERSSAFLRAGHETWSEAFARIERLDAPVSSRWPRLSVSTCQRRSAMRNPCTDPQIGDVIQDKEGHKRTVIAPRADHSSVRYLESNTVHECSEEQWRDWARYSKLIRAA